MMPDHQLMLNPDDVYSAATMNARTPPAKRPISAPKTVVREGTATIASARRRVFAPRTHPATAPQTAYTSANARTFHTHNTRKIAQYSFKGGVKKNSRQASSRSAIFFQQEQMALPGPKPGEVHIHFGHAGRKTPLLKIVSMREVHFDLPRSQIDMVPPTIGKLVNLVSLNLSFNKFKTLPPEIGLLVNLENLALEDVKTFTTLPPEIGLLTKLQHLNLELCPITVLPKEIGLLVNLQVLKFAESNLFKLPPEIGLLSSLRSLNLSRNKLTTLPVEIGLLANLEWLYLESNQFKALPPQIGFLPRLQKIYITENPFEDQRIRALANLRDERGEEVDTTQEVLKIVRFLCCEHSFQKDSVSGNCEMCGNKFKGLIKKKGMICSRCGGMVHEGCLAGAMERLPQPRPQPPQKPQPPPVPALQAAAPQPTTEKTKKSKVVEKARQMVADARREVDHFSPVQAVTTGPPTKQSSVADVRRWLVSIDLGEIAGIFERNRIDGSVLFDLSETDLEKIGVAAFGHRKKLLSTLRDLQTPPSAPFTASPDVVAASSIPDSRAAAATTGGSALPQQRRAKFFAPESESVTYKGLLELPDSYKPQGTCAQELLAARAVLGSKVPQLEEIVKEVGSVSWSILAGQTAQELVKTHGLTEQEVFAIVAYTYDLGLSGVQSENLYFQLNELLRRRVAHEMRAVMGFLYFILGALRKLPAFEGTVFRGNNSPGMVASDYTTGREIFWSGFTSTTTDLAAALDFAGRDGVVFRIKINSGRSIAVLSVMQRENEVLLPPNACLMVFSEMHREADGVQYVDLVEKKDSFRW